MATNEFLPLGTIVRLKEGKKKLMIFARHKELVQTGAVFDYVGCLYPEGYMNVETAFVFNHDAVEEVLHRGFQDEEETAFQKILEQASLTEAASKKQ